MSAGSVLSKVRCTKWNESDLWSSLNLKGVLGALSHSITNKVCLLLCSVHMYVNRKQSFGQPAQLLAKRTRPLLLCVFSQVGISPLFTQEVTHAPLQGWCEVVEGNCWLDYFYWHTHTLTHNETPWGRDPLPHTQRCKLKLHATALSLCHPAPVERLCDRSLTVGRDEWGEVPVCRPNVRPSSVTQRKCQAAKGLREERNKRSKNIIGWIEREWRWWTCFSVTTNCVVWSD